MTRAIPVGLLTFLTVACSDTSERAETVTVVSDSAGVEIAVTEGPTKRLEVRETLDQVLAGADGSLWVRRADVHPRPAERATAAAFGYAEYAWLEAWKADLEFDLFSSEGTYRGTVTLPRDFVPMAVAGDRVCGVLRDDLDVEYIAGFEVLPAS